MFSSTITIFWIQKDTITVLDVYENGRVKSQETFSDVQTAQKKHKDIDALLLSDQFVYSVTLEKNIDKKEIQSQAEQKIPEHLSQIPWSYTESNDAIIVWAVTSGLKEKHIDNLTIDRNKPLPLIPIGMLQTGADSATELSQSQWKELIVMLKSNKNLPIVTGGKQKDTKQAKEQTRQVKKQKESLFDKNPRLLTYLIILLIAAIGFVSALLWKMDSSDQDQTNIPTQTSPISKPTTDNRQLATTPTPSREDYAIQILNGSGTAGAAGAVEDLLDDEGYKVVETGNAETFDNRDTEIQAKTSVSEAVLDELDNVLKNNYSVIRGVDLEENEEVDIIIIVGTTK